MSFVVKDSFFLTAKGAKGREGGKRLRSPGGDGGIMMLYKDEVYEIIGAAIEVHREMGPGFLEAVYHQALESELQNRGIPFQSQVELPLFYKGQQLEVGYQADLICFEAIVVELKAVHDLKEIHQAQILNYMKATGIQVGLLINFRSYPRLEWKRFILRRETGMGEEM